MKSLIVGHSQVKYFHEYVCLPDIKCLSFSGCQIEDLLPKPDVKQRWDISQIKKSIPECQVSDYLFIYLFIYLFCTYTFKNMFCIQKKRFF